MHGLGLLQHGVTERDIAQAQAAVPEEDGLQIRLPSAFQAGDDLSQLGVQVLRIQGRSAIDRVSLAVSEHRAPARVAVDGALGFLGALLLVVPGFLTAVLGALLLFPLTRTLTRRWISRRYAARVMSFAATAGRFAPGNRVAQSFDFESTAIDDDLDQLSR